MLPTLPTPLSEFLLTTIFSFLIGLEYHNYLKANQYQFSFGSIRTFLLVGLFGLLLYQLNPNGQFFLAGLGVLGLLLAIFYWRQSAANVFTLLEIILTFSVFLLGPIIVNFPSWYLILFSVSLILVLSEKSLIHQFSRNLDNREIITLAKFLILSGVILPLLPDREISALIPVTYYKIWLAVIIISALSYASYLAQTYLFKSRGLLLTGILGGLYSSTAVTVVISRRAKQMKQEWPLVSASLIIATAMMYLRLLIIVYLLNESIGHQLLLPFSLFIIGSCLIAFGLLFFNHQEMYKHPSHTSQHPLELPTALAFAFMFVVFTLMTEYVAQHYGNHGLKFLALIVGFTDIDPFILSLLSGKFTVDNHAIVASVIIATASNNLLKAFYAVLFARNQAVTVAVICLVLLALTSFAYIFLST